MAAEPESTPPPVRPGFEEGSIRRRDEVDEDAEYLEWMATLTPYERILVVQEISGVANAQPIRHQGGVSAFRKVRIQRGPGTQEPSSRG